jgi:hypothetical protein
MSEYWSYDFLAVDQPLSPAEQIKLRSISSRARITARSFWNEYHYGDLKADPSDLLARYFDVYCHTGCFRWHTLGLRLPAELPDRDLWIPFLPSLKKLHRGKLLLLCDNGEDPDCEYDEFPDEGTQDLVPLRSEILSGDSRPLYLAWLRRLKSRELEDDQLEPPVPPGLASLTAAQEAMVSFLEIDEYLLAVAAEASLPLDPENTSSDPTSAIAALPVSEKDNILGLLASGQADFALAQLRIQLAPSATSSETSGTRSVADLQARAEILEDQADAEHLRRMAENEALLRAQEAQRRKQHLDSLEGQEDKVWRKIQSLVSETKAYAYDQAAILLVDLRDLAQRGGKEKSFERRLGNLRKKHSRRSSFLRRLEAALNPAESAPPSERGRR